MTQVNTRIDSEVKERGDVALAQAGYSPSRAMRAIWGFAASHAHEPEVVRSFLQQAEGEQASAREEAVAARLEALEEGLGLHGRLENALGFHSRAAIDLDDRQLHGEAVLSRWEGRGLL